MAMKLASLVAVLVFSGVAYAQPAPMNPYAAPPPPPQPQQRAERMQARGEMRQFLLQHFDRNRDGRLEPRERQRAARVLQRIAQKLMRNEGRQMRRKAFVRRYDLNRDGNVGPGEMPPAVANELRPLDRDGDGWLEGDELP